MKKQAVVFVCFFLLTGLAGCGVPTHISLVNTPTPDERPYKTISVMLTETASVSTSVVVTTVVAGPLPSLPAAKTVLAQPSAQITPSLPPVTIPTQTPSLPASDPTATDRPAPTPNLNTLPGGQTLPCNLAHPGRPIDITIPDETHFAPGEYFSKTWRLVNAGACLWTPEYAVVWFSGEDMAITRVQPLFGPVAPGATTDITVEMVAPQQPGVYQSNWKLRSDRGELFGIGPTGDSPFWVRIVVVPVATETPTPAPPEATDTPLIYAAGRLTLLPADGVDLDNLSLNQNPDDDLWLESISGEQGDPALVLFPVNGARVAFFGLSAPEQSECTLMPLFEDPLDLGRIETGSFLCYRTTQGLPGRAAISSVDPATGQVELEFLTWAVP